MADHIGTDFEPEMVMANPVRNRMLAFSGSPGILGKRYYSGDGAAAKAMKYENRSLQNTLSIGAAWYKNDLCSPRSW